MKFHTEAVVTGIKFFNDTVEGKHYKSTTVYCLVDMDESQRSAKGQACAEYKSDDVVLFEKLKGFDFPVNCRLLLEQVTNGKATKTRVLDVIPATAQKAG